MKRLIATLTLVVMLISCGSRTEANARNASRFVLIHSTSWYDVVVDTETGVEYSVSKGAYNCGNMTVLVDKNGKPLIWKREVTE